MLAEFQQALADMVASPALCGAAMERPDLLRQRYRLDEREWRRLRDMVAHRGMAANCMLYRANRLTPLALNLPLVCAALGPELRAVVDGYWSAHPGTDVHFLLESDRFRTFVAAALARDELPGVDRAVVADALAAEGAVLTDRLAASRAWGPLPPAEGGSPVA